METPVNRYADKFPQEISRAVDGLSGETERAVFVLLHDEGDLAFSEIASRLSSEEEEMHNQTLTNALSSLQKGGLIQKRVADDSKEGDFRAYYQLTGYGERFVNALFDTLGEASKPQGRRRPVIQVDQSDLFESSREMKREFDKSMKKLTSP